jgi:hypothetical protein
MDTSINDVESITYSGILFITKSRKPQIDHFSAVASHQIPVLDQQSGGPVA